MLRFVREGDVVVVHSMDRLARNLDNLRRIVQDLTKRGIRVEFVKEGLHLYRRRFPDGEFHAVGDGSVCRVREGAD